RAQQREAGLFEQEIAFEDLAEILADQQFIEVLEVGQPAEEQDAVDQLVGILHLVERLFVFMVAELLDAPMAQHPRMQEILVDGSELGFQHRIQMLDDGLIAPHVRPPQMSACAATAKLTPLRENRSTPRKEDQSAPALLPSTSAAWRSIWRTKGTHLPHCGWQPQAR